MSYLMYLIWNKALLRKRYWGRQHLWARGYFVATSGQVIAEAIHIEGQKVHHGHDNFKTFEFSEFTLCNMFFVCNLDLSAFIR